MNAWERLSAPGLKAPWIHLPWPGRRNRRLRQAEARLSREAAEDLYRLRQAVQDERRRLEALRAQMGGRTLGGAARVTDSARLDLHGTQWSLVWPDGHHLPSDRWHWPKPESKPLANPANAEATTRMEPTPEELIRRSLWQQTPEPIRSRLMATRRSPDDARCRHFGSIVLASGVQLAIVGTALSATQGDLTGFGAAILTAGVGAAASGAALLKQGAQHWWPRWTGRQQHTLQRQQRLLAGQQPILTRLPSGAEFSACAWALWSAAQPPQVEPRPAPSASPWPAPPSVTRPEPARQRRSIKIQIGAARRMITTDLLEA